MILSWTKVVIQSRVLHVWWQRSFNLQTADNKKIHLSRSSLRWLSKQILQNFDIKCPSFLRNDQIFCSDRLIFLERLLKYEWSNMKRTFVDDQVLKGLIEFVIIIPYQSFDMKGIKFFALSFYKVVRIL